MIDDIGRFAIGAIICTVLYFAGRVIWPFPLDDATYWFAVIYSVVCSFVFRALQR
ncbi:hypothetical protein EVB39_004 [Rhizobium phage RHph_TM3_3_9]|nr:hypothetical protein EVB39_004 [Rhizobium phage RHph_TM3_3_9]QIG68526.1 hypothetical protein EVB66_004 [Rhizobium phage RHph_TM3_3_13]QIG74384.1 hypothetical protein EVC09_003 [Rhizobium phage RHph_TM3_3_10]QXV74497.1 hypothetical protein [Rhizobium phage RHEph19]